MFESVHAPRIPRGRGRFVEHGTQKLFGWFGGHGPDGTGQFFESIGLRPGRPNATDLLEGVWALIGVGPGPSPTRPSVTYVHP